MEVVFEGHLNRRTLAKGAGRFLTLQESTYILYVLVFITLMLMVPTPSWSGAEKLGHYKRCML